MPVSNLAYHGGLFTAEISVFKEWDGTDKPENVSAGGVKGESKLKCTYNESSVQSVMPFGADSEQ